MRRLPILGAALIMLGVALALATPAGARPVAPAQAADQDAGEVSVLKVEGLIDPATEG